MTDIVAGMTASWLAGRQAKKRSTERTQALANNPKLPQEEYQHAREVILGKDFATTPAGAPCIPCMANTKAARRAERLNLVSQGIVACPAHAEVAARLRQDMDQVEHARVADAVYLKYDADAPADLKAPPPGFLDPSDDELASLGLTPNQLAPQGTNFRAAVYKKDPAVWGDDPKPRYDVVFRGTTLSKEDWENNFAQNANNHSDYYQRATLIGNAIAEAGAVDQVQLVGHSLGGGLASAAQGGSGSIATTYNAAGLNPQTVVKYSKIKDRVAAEPDKILAYHVEGEVVTKTQESGITQYFSHAAPGQRKITPPTSDALSAEDRHGMVEVISSIEKQKTADQATLEACLASK